MVVFSHLMMKMLSYLRCSYLSVFRFTNSVMVELNRRSCLPERLAVWFARGWSEALWSMRLWVHRALSRANVLEEICRKRKDNSGMFMKEFTKKMFITEQYGNTHLPPAISYPGVMMLFVLCLTWLVVMNMTWPLHGRVNNPFCRIDTRTLGWSVGCLVRRGSSRRFRWAECWCSSCLIAQT